MALDYSQYLGNYGYDPQRNITLRNGFIDPARLVFDGGWYEQQEGGLRPLLQNDNDTGYVDSSLLTSRSLGEGDLRNQWAREDLLATAPYADRYFDDSLQLVRMLDPTASEEDVFAAAQRASQLYDAPGQYMPRARVAQRVADDYMSATLGKPFSVESLPGVSDWIRQAEQQASNTKTTWKEAAPYLLMFASAGLGGWLGGYEGIAAEGVTGATAGGAAAAPTAADVYSAALAQAGVTGAEAANALQSLLAYDAATVAGAAAGNAGSGWVSGSDLPSGIYNTSTGAFAPSALAGLPPGDYLTIGGATVPAGSLPPTQMAAAQAGAAGSASSALSNARTLASLAQAGGMVNGLLNGNPSGGGSGSSGGGGGLLGTGERYAYTLPSNVRQPMPTSLLDYASGPEHEFFSPEYFKIASTRRKVS